MRQHLCTGADCSSGLKSAAARAIEVYGGASAMSGQQKAALASEFQSAAFAPLEDKIVRSVISPAEARQWGYARGWSLADSHADTVQQIRSIVCSGGVAANGYLRRWYVERYSQR